LNIITDYIEETLIELEIDPELAKEVRNTI